MATFKAEVYAHQKRSDGTYNIKIRVIHLKQKKHLSTPYYVYSEDLTRTFKIKNQHYIDQCDILVKQYRNICDRLGERIKTMSVEQIVEYINRGSQNDYFDLDFIAYGRAIVQEMHDAEHHGNALAYQNALNNLVKFVGRESVSVKEITVRFVKDWIKWIQEQPARVNRSKGSRAQSLYPSTIRAIHNRAKDEFNDEEMGLIRIPLSPFKKIPKVEPSKKRALEVEQLRHLMELDYTTILQPGNNRFNMAKDVFLLSFGLIGMNAVDLYSCDIFKKDRIIYQRTKTKNRRADKAEISIKVEPELKALFEKYRDPSGERVFGFYHWYSSVNAFSVALNKGLKSVGNLLGVDDLEFYAARHTWATIAVNEADVDKFAVHTALNHVDEKMKVTDIYIKKSWAPIDKANRKVLDYVKFKIENVEEPKSEKYLNKQLSE